MEAPHLPRAASLLEHLLGGCHSFFQGLKGNSVYAPLLHLVKTQGKTLPPFVIGLAQFAWPRLYRYIWGTILLVVVAAGLRLVVG